MCNNARYKPVSSASNKKNENKTVNLTKLCVLLTLSFDYCKLKYYAAICNQLPSFRT